MSSPGPHTPPAPPPCPHTAPSPVPPPAQFARRPPKHEVPSPPHPAAHELPHPTNVPPPADQRGLPPSSSSIASMSSSPRGRRAPAPAALDLAAGTDWSKYPALGLGLGAAHGPGNRRVVTEPVSRVLRCVADVPVPVPVPAHVPPPAPSARPAAPRSVGQCLPVTARCQLQLVSFFPSTTLTASIHACPTSNLASAPYSAQLSSTAQPHPASIDRRNLVGVGELSTPRTPGSGPPLPPTATNPQEDRPAMDESRPRSISAARTPPRPAPTSTRETLTVPNTAAHDGQLYSVASLAQFNFDSTMEGSLAASLATLSTPPKTNSPKSPVVPQLDSILPPSPGSARSRIYARRQERANAAASISQPIPGFSQPSPSRPQPFAESQTPSQRTGRDVRKTPPNSASSRHSTSHDILKQFAVKDFSHLPPSPSSASINQFLRSSGSTQNISSGTPPGSASASGAYFSSKGVQREDSQKSQKHQQRTTPKPKELDPNVDEALRKLDGLTSTPGKNKARSKSSGGPSAASSRPGTPVAVAVAVAIPETKSSRSESKIPLKPSIGSFKDTTGSPLNNWIDLTEDIPAIPIPRAWIPPQPNRESSSSASATGTPNSHESQSLPTTATTMSSADLPEGMEKSVPPVPPLPQVYVNKKQQGIPPAVQSGGVQPPSYVSMHELSPEPLPSSPSKSTSPLTTATTAPVPVPPKMHKKWSFSSALNLKSAASPVDEMALSQSPQTPWSEIHRGELFSPNVHVQGQGQQGQGQEPRGDSGPRQGATPLAPPPPPSSASSKASSSNVNKRLTPSSIPFFRRSSSSSFHKTNQSVIVPETPKQVDKVITATTTATAIPSSQSQSRKSVLGMHFPSMLRGSSSKRGLAQQATQQATQQTGQSQVPVKEKEEVKAASAPSATSGWTGRKRGKVCFLTTPM